MENSLHSPSSDNSSTSGKLTPLDSSSSKEDELRSRRESSPKYENVSDVETLHTDSEGEEGEEEEDVDHVIATVFFCGPLMEGGAGKRMSIGGNYSNVTSQAGSSNSALPTIDYSSDTEGAVGGGLTDCEDISSDDEGEWERAELVVSESAITNYLEVVSGGETTESCRVRSGSDVSSIGGDGIWELEVMEEGKEEEEEGAEGGGDN